MTNESTIELGLPGLEHSGGWLDDEWHQRLRGSQGALIYREMSDNDATVGGALYSIESFLRRVQWDVKPAVDSPEAERWAEFVEECMHDMDGSWDSFISDALTMLPYGYSLHEIVYKIRRGPDSASKRFRSKYSDGKVGWRALAQRSQTTIDRWDIDDKTGVIYGAYQTAPPLNVETYLPLDRCLLFRTKTERNNPEGKSVLRRAYRSWSFKKRIEEIEAVGISRDLNGLPVMTIPAKLMSPTASPAEQAVRAEFKKLMSLVARDQLSSMVLPAEFDSDNHPTGYKFHLVSSGGTKQIPADPVIRRYDARILMSLAAEFLLLGTEKQGSFSLGSEKNANFIRSLEWYVQVIADQMDIAIGRLMQANGVPAELWPSICYEPLSQPSLQELGTFLQQMTQGALLTPTMEVEEHVRKAAKLPEPTTSEREMIQERLDRLEDAEEMAAKPPTPSAPSTPEPAEESDDASDEA